MLMYQFCLLLDVSVTNVALPSIGRSTGASPAELQWIVSGYIELKRDVLAIYTAANAAAARVALDELTEKWGTRYRAMIGLCTAGREAVDGSVRDVTVDGVDERGRSDGLMHGSSETLCEIVVPGSGC
jgi:MFS family permease